MEELQMTYPEEYKATSSHRRRAVDDVQLGFLYNNFLIENGLSSGDY